MKRTYGLLGLVSLGLGGCSFDGIDGNGNRVEETREVAAFSRVQNDGELDVDVVQGDEQSLTISIDSNLQGLVRSRVSGDTLYLDLRDNVDRMVGGPHVLITLPDLRAARLSGSGLMTIGFDQPTLPLDLYLSGSGELRFDGTAATLGAFLDGSGEIRLAGESRDVELSLHGSGHIAGRNLMAESGDLDLSGSGTLSANVSQSVRVSLSGSGEIDVFGGAKVESSKRTGSGDIDFH